MQAKALSNTTAWMLCGWLALPGGWSCAEESAAAPQVAAVATWGDGIDQEQGWVSMTSLAAVNLEWPTAQHDTPLAEVASGATVPQVSTTPESVGLINEPVVDSAAAETPELHGLLRRVAWVTGSLAVVAMLALWFFRAWLTRPRLVGRSGRTLQLIESLRIGSRCGVFLVQADQHRVLISVDQGRGMQMLTLPASFADALHDIPAEGDDVEPVVTRSEPASDFFGGLASRRIWRAGAST